MPFNSFWMYSKLANLSLGLLKVKTTSIVGVELVDKDSLGITFLEEFVVIEIAIVGGDTVKVSHIDGLGSFFFG